MYSVSLDDGLKVELVKNNACYTGIYPRLSWNLDLFLFLGILTLLHTHRILPSRYTTATMTKLSTGSPIDRLTNNWLGSVHGSNCVTKIR